MTEPEVLIEQWLPVKELGIESVRERAAASALPPIYFLHVWWARRPLVASAGAILPSLLPAWSEDLAARFADDHEISSEEEYHAWVLRLLGILGDTVAERARIDAANDAGIRLKGGGFTYKQAYKNHPAPEDVDLFHRMLVDTWGEIPTVADPTAGGGSIPFESIRYGLPTIANDLNPIAVAVMRAGVEIPAKYGRDIVPDLEKWGQVLSDRVKARLAPFFEKPQRDERVVAYIFARSIACPRTGKPVPLAPNWWLTKDKGGQAVRLITHRGGRELDAPEFEIVQGPEFEFDPSKGTVSHGKGVSPWDNLVIEGDYIKAEAQAGRMGSILYAVANRTSSGRGFRAPTPTDLDALAAAEQELQRLLPNWEADDVLPDEDFPPGNDNRPITFGMGYVLPAAASCARHVRRGVPKDDSRGSSSDNRSGPRRCCARTARAHAGQGAQLECHAVLLERGEPVDEERLRSSRFLLQVDMGGVRGSDRAVCVESESALDFVLRNLRLAPSEVWRPSCDHF